MTCAPIRTSAWAVAWPIPELEPVTMHTLPFMSTSLGTGPITAKRYDARVSTRAIASVTSVPPWKVTYERTPLAVAT